MSPLLVADEHCLCAATKSTRRYDSLARSVDGKATIWAPLRNLHRPFPESTRPEKRRLPIQAEPREFLPQGGDITFEDTIVRAQEIQPLAMVRPDCIMYLQRDSQAKSFGEVAG